MRVKVLTQERMILSCLICKISAITKKALCDRCSLCSVFPIIIDNYNNNNNNNNDNNNIIK